VNIFAYFAFLSWPLIIFGLFTILPARRAAVTGLIGGWLLLPPYVIPISHLPDYSKNTATSLGIFLGTLVFASDRILAFRPRWFDLPVLGWCLCPICTSLQNGLGLYDGLSGSLNQIIAWGIPYLFGRLYFSDFAGLRELTVGMVAGSLLCVIPCLYEIRMSPQLLRYVYGRSNLEAMRYGGYRPRLFLTSGLELGMWMTAAALTAWWLWRCGTLKRLWQLPFGGVLLPILMITTILCRSTGALLLMIGGMGVLWICTRYQTRALLWCLVLTAPVYMAVRIPNLWSGESVVALAKTVSRQRAQSLGYRFKCENLLVAKALKQPVFGWGGWGRSRVYFPGFEGNPYAIVPTDGLWIIALGLYGYVGLSLLYLTLELPVLLFLRRFPARLWRHPLVAPAAVVAVLLGIYAIDCLLNGFINLIYMAIMGGLTSLRPSHAGLGHLSASQTSAISKRSGVRLRRAAIAEASAGLTGLERRDGSPPPRGSLATVPKIGLADQYRSTGRALKEQGRSAEAQTAWQHALDLLTELTAAHPDAPDLQERWCDCANDLAWFQLDHTDLAFRDPVSAVTLARKAAALRPACSIYWNTLGAAYCRAGDFPSAIAALNRAMILGKGGTAFDHVFLAMAYARLGNQEQARRWLAQAMLGIERHYPGHPELLRLSDEVRSTLSMGRETSTAAR